MRVLGVVRLSRETDESTSPERQRETVTKWADLHGHTIIGWAEDLDVSGALSPWERPGLGPWLSGRTDEFDGLVAWKVDRISRRLLHFVSLVEWADQRGKVVASATEPINTSDRFGRMIASMLAMFAEFERDAMKERIADGREALRREGRWGGGHPPYGYRPMKVDGGWKLEPDPEAAEVVRELASRVIGGASVLSTCRDLNERGVRTRGGAEWTASAAFRVLRSRTIIGQAEYNGKPLADSDGILRRIAEPIISDTDFRKLQTILDDRAKAPRMRTHGAALLLGVGFCECGLRLYRQGGVSKGKLYGYYVCSGRKGGKNAPCANKPIPSAVLDEAAEDGLMALTGGLEFTERQFIPGVNHEEEIAQVDRAIREAREEWDLGLYGDDRKGYLERLSRLNERRGRLAAEPNTPDRWEEVPTGRTFREVYGDLETVEERRAFLLASGLRVVLHSAPARTPSMLTGEPSREESRVSVEIPHDLQQRVLAHAQGYGKTADA
ncbi:recombinase family protein [Micromonospora sp. NPDC005299]|uniref:recombinase family protein n=1 Tax=Micromonospora sp. NPDC005299 TaxID=3364231 RepID=UPI00367A38CA